MKKCPVCAKKFSSHQGLGGHLSGPCGQGAKTTPAVKAVAPEGPAQVKADAKLGYFGRVDGVRVCVYNGPGAPPGGMPKSFTVCGRSREEVIRVIDEALEKAFGLIHAP